MFSEHYSPSVGGIERSSEMLASGLAARGHAVTVITTSHASGDAADPSDIHLLRNPPVKSLIMEARRADVVFHNGVSMRRFWVHWIARKPLVVAVHIWLRRNSGDVSAKDRFKQFMVGRATRIVAVSPAIASHLSARAEVIGNSYLTETFRDLGNPRDLNTIVVVSRLVPDKGVDVLIEAIAEIRSRGFEVKLRIIGDGHIAHELRDLSIKKGVSDHVDFLGIVQGDNLNARLNECEIMVVPSRWEEPFGIVALEGLAAGCVVVVTDGGGLPFAIGDSGSIVPRGDVNGLAIELERLLRDPAYRKASNLGVEEHLAQFAPDTVVSAYESVLIEAIARK